VRTLECPRFELFWRQAWLATGHFFETFGDAVRELVKANPSQRRPSNCAPAARLLYAAALYRGTRWPILANSNCSSRRLWDLTGIFRYVLVWVEKEIFPFTAARVHRRCEGRRETTTAAQSSLPTFHTVVVNDGIKSPNRALCALRFALLREAVVPAFGLRDRA
jgi:hypothetical protein